MCWKCCFFGLGSQIGTDRDFKRAVIIKQWKNPNALSGIVLLHVAGEIFTQFDKVCGE